MNRATTLLSSWYLAFGCALTAVGFAVPADSVRDAIYLVAALQVFPTLLVARRFNELSWKPVILFAGVGVCFAGEQLLSGSDPTWDNPLAVVLALIGVAAW